MRGHRSCPTESRAQLRGCGSSSSPPQRSCDSGEPREAMAGSEGFGQGALGAAWKLAGHGTEAALAAGAWLSPQPGAAAPGRRRHVNRLGNQSPQLHAQLQLKTSSRSSRAVPQTRALWIPAPRTEQRRSQQPGDAFARRKCSLYASACQQQLQSAQNQFCAANKTAPNDV